MSTEDTVREALVNLLKQMGIDISSLTVMDPDEYSNTLDPNARFIYKLNSDNTDYIVGINENGDPVFFFKGVYGGYISKSENAEKATSLFLVNVEKEEVKRVSASELLGKEVAEKYKEIQKVVVSKVKYRLLEIEAEIINKDTYKLIRKVKPGARQYEAEAYVVSMFLGHRRDGVDEDRAEVIKAKYAALLKLPLYVSVVSGKKAKWDEFYLRLKVVTKAPQIIGTQKTEVQKIEEEESPEDEELVPVTSASEAPAATATPTEIPIAVEKEVEKPSLETRLVPLYVVDFKLPSFQLSRIEHKSNIDGALLETLNRYYVDLGYRLEAIRVAFYSKIQKSFYSTVFGWVSPSEEDAKAVLEARDEAVKSLENVIKDVSNEADKMLNSNDPKKKEIGLALKNIVRKLEDRKQQLVSVRVFKIYVEPEDALYVASKVVKDIGSAVEALRKEVEEKKSAYKSRRLRTLEGIMEKWKKLIKNLEAYERQKSEVPLV
jgi:hypothetical protein